MILSKVSLFLWTQDPKIAIQSFDASPDYIFRIVKATLHVPGRFYFQKEYLSQIYFKLNFCFCLVGQMTNEAFSQYEIQLQKRNAKIRLRRWLVKVQNIVASTTDFDSRLYN